MHFGVVVCFVFLVNACVDACVSMVLLKIHLTENAAHKEARLSEVEAEMGRCRAACTRLEQVQYNFSLIYH